MYTISNVYLVHEELMDRIAWLIKCEWPECMEWESNIIDQWYRYDMLYKNEDNSSILDWGDNYKLSI